MSDDEIEQRIAQIREGGRGTAPGSRRGGADGRAAPVADGENADIPPFMAQRIKDATPEELDRIKERMRQFGLSEERIDEIVAKVRGEGAS